MTSEPLQNYAVGAPLWRRFAAMVYDSFLLLALSMAYGFATQFIHALIYGAGEQDYQPKVSGVAFLLGWLLTLATFYIFFWCRAGQTAGMRAWRLKVVKRSALPAQQLPTLKQSALRAPLSIAALIFAGLGYWWRFADQQGDCLHDKLSQTRVVVTPPRKKKNP